MYCIQMKVNVSLTHDISNAETFRGRRFSKTAFDFKDILMNTSK